MSKVPVISLSCILFYILNVANPASGNGLQIENQVIPHRIVSDRMVFGTRTINIILDEKDFSVDKLKFLMKHFFKNYPTPERFMVFVATHNSQSGDFAVYSDPSKRPGALHPYGAIFREKDKEFIRYRLPKEKLQTIVMKDKTHEPNPSGMLT